MSRCPGEEVSFPDTKPRVSEEGHGGSMYSQATASPGISNKASCAHVIDRVAKTPGSGSVGAMVRCELR